MDQIRTGNTIARLRKRSGLTQAGLAEKLGVSDKAVSKWERGLSCPDPSIWNKLSILLDTDIESLLYGHEGRSEWKGVLFLDNSISADMVIFNKPLIYYLLSQFFLAGINDIAIIGECVSITLPGVRITSAKSLIKLNHWFTKPAFFIYGNRFLYGPNLTRHFKRAMSRLDGITVLSVMKRRGQYPIAIDTDRKAVQAETSSLNQYFAEPFVFMAENHHWPQCDCFADILEKKDINVEVMGRGMMSFNIHTYEDAFQLSEYIRLMEELTGERIGCVEEILVRRGLAEYRDVKEVCDKETKLYLEGLF